ncbi:lipopolysaccharide heptosyltransferase I [Chitinimonas sp. BJYL2]|uniref:lipopolysaccharide heptosyltransferase I n=1 Tax=Chitinimonas sp. BJYL2 TaxID=2976696 RepID=UPI0022B4BCF4|nr:lipopolysaccharide heptosyltransferase I [Chitinimonas sp. BJYL2]
MADTRRDDAPRRILIIKLSAMGDQLFTAAAVTDLKRRWPDAEIDWLVDERFADIPRMHQHVARVLAIPLKRWSRSLGSLQSWRALFACIGALRAHPYDLVIDGQGLWKSALCCALARASRRVGFSADACGEAPAARFYDAHFHPAATCHAVARQRALVAFAADTDAARAVDYGLQARRSPRPSQRVVFLHGVSRDHKLWDEDHWIALGRRFLEAGWQIDIAWGSDAERQRAERMGAGMGAGAQLLPRLPLQDWPDYLAGCGMVVGLDTGLTHLAAACRTPTLALFTATDPAFFQPAPGYGVALGGIDVSPTVEQVWQAGMPWRTAACAPDQNGN